MKFKAKPFIIVIILLFPVVLNAQQEIDVFEDSALISKGKQLGYAVYIPQGEFDDIKKDWSKLIRQNTKSRVEEVGMEINISGTTIKEIHFIPINIYSIIYQKDTAFLLIAFFEIDSMFFTFDENNKTLKSEKIYHGIRHLIRDFAVEEYKKAVKNELEEEEKTLKKLDKEFANLKKENENAHKEIEKCGQEITNSEHAITTYEADNERKLTEINDRKESMASLSNRQTRPILMAGILPSAAYLQMVISCNLRYFANSFVDAEVRTLSPSNSYLTIWVVINLELFLTTNLG